MKLLRKAMPAFIISVVILLVGLYITIYLSVMVSVTALAAMSFVV